MATVRAAIGVAAAELPGVPLFAGGKSFGGRMTSELASREALPGVLGLAFLGFPLHAPKKPDVKRSTHLYQVPIPMLFLQGTRDDLAELGACGASAPTSGRGPRCTKWKGRIIRSTC